MRIIKFCFTILLTSTLHFAFGQSGSLDPLFGNNGIVITDFDNRHDVLVSLEIQTDQKIIAIGGTGAFVRRFLACRYNTDGTIDTSFGDHGFFFSVIPPEIFVCQASALQSNGKVIMAGVTTTFNVSTKSEEEDFLLMRVNKEGIPDSTFGTFGMVQTDLSGTAFERPEAIVVQNDGKILVAGEGFAESGIGVFYAIVRYQDNGQIDTTFGNKGMQIINEEMTIQTMVLQSDGKILIGGYSTLDSTANFEIRRFEANGSFDNSFGVGGYVSTDLSGQSDYVDGIVLEPDGRIFVSGGANFSGGKTDLAFARYKSDGTLDASYSNDGFEIIPLPPYSNVLDLARQPDGKYVLCGSSKHLDGIAHGMLIRINHNGGLDESFGDQGVVYMLEPDNYHGARTLVVQDNNYIVLGGEYQEPGEDSDFALTRYIVDDVVVSTEEHNIKSTSFIASPNPCKDFFSVDFGKANTEFHYTLSDLTGNVILNKNVVTDGAGKLVIDTRNLVPGLYSVLFENKSMRGTLSIVIQQ